jgi:hypothetical protein
VEVTSGLLAPGRVESTLELLRQVKWKRLWNCSNIQRIVPCGCGIPTGPLRWRDHAGIHPLLFGSGVGLGCLCWLRGEWWCSASSLVSGLDVKSIGEFLGRQWRELRRIQPRASRLQCGRPQKKSTDGGEERQGHSEPSSQPSSIPSSIAFAQIRGIRVEKTLGSPEGKQPTARILLCGATMSG